MNYRSNDKPNYGANKGGQQQQANSDYVRAGVAYLSKSKNGKEYIKILQDDNKPAIFLFKNDNKRTDTDPDFFASTKG